MNFSFVEPWDLFLPREAGHVVALCGSGGKTSLLMEFARRLEADMVKTIITCTTRTEPLEGYPVYDLADLKSDDLPPRFFLRDGVNDEGKWLGLSGKAVDELGEKFPEYIVLAEVDGSAKMPLKYYRDGEPVWPRRTSLAIIVMSMAAVGDASSSVVHRFETGGIDELRDLKPETVWLWDHSYTLLTAAGGYLDQVPGEIPVVLAMTCMAGQDDSIGLFEFAGKAMENERLPLVVFCETTGENPSFRTSCRREADDESEDETTE